MEVRTHYWNRTVVTCTAAILLLLSLTVLSGAATAEVPVEIRVHPGQTVNAAIAEVDGPVCILLPPGLVEHDAAITRNETVIIKGAGEQLTTLRPAASLGPNEGVALVEQTEGYDGDFVLRDLTYDRAHHPGTTPENPDVATGATIFRVSARNRVEFSNVTIEHFDFGAREGEANAGCPFVFSKTLRRNRTGGEYAWHTNDITWHNVTVDFKKNGGIRHRPGGQHLAFDFGTVDRILVDGNCRFYGHLCQNANPEYTVGEVWRDRGNSGPMFGISLWVYEHAFLDGIWYQCDYGAWRQGGVAAEDAVIEWRMDLLQAGYGDKFWQRPFGYGTPEPNPGRPAGHVIYRDMRLIGNRTGELWNDYGIKVVGGWKSLTVEGCTVINRGHPLSFIAKGDREFGRITIRNSTFAPVGGGGPGIEIDGFDRYESLVIDNVSIYPDRESGKNFLNTGIAVTETGEGGGLFTVRNVTVEDYLYQLFDDNTGPATTVETSGLMGRRATPQSLVDDAEPIAVFPKEGRQFTIDGMADETEGMEPLATINDFERTGPFTQIDVHMAFHSGPGVFVQVIVNDDKFGNANQYPAKTYRGDALQFFITRGRPGEVAGGTLWDICRHDTKGLTAYRRNFWPDQDLPTGLVDIPMEVKYHEDKRQIVYEFMLPWEEIGMPGPWYDDICVDLFAVDGDAYGAHYKGAIWTHDNASAAGEDAIVHSTEPRSRGAQWLKFGAEKK